MNFDHIIMNPPYNRNLHLKILQEAMKHSNDVVNLSPIRWLQDPLADYTHPWTDEMLYEYFGLTEEEIKEIEKSIK